MKQLYALLVIILLCLELSSQTTLVSGHPYDANGTGLGFQFWVENTTASTIRLTRINMRNNIDFKPVNNTYTIWYKPNAGNTTPGAISTANGWTNAGSFNHNNKFSTLYPIVSNMSIDIPSGDTFRIWVAYTGPTGGNASPTMALHIATAGAINTFSSAGVNLITGDSVSWWGAPPTSGPNINPLAAFVGSIEFYPLAACSGTPNAGTIMGEKGFCGSEAKFYYLDGYSSGNGITYQWQSSTTLGGTYTNVGTNTTMYKRTATTSAYIRCVATCGTLRDTTAVFADTLKPFYHCYCNSSATNTADTKIDSVVFATTRAGTASTICETYTDNRSLPIPVLRAGATYNIEVVNGSCSGNFFNSRGAVFVDLNRNGTFDAAERVGSGWTASGLQQKFDNSLTLPVSTPLGITGLRALHREGLGSPPTSANMCGTYTYGETEDYLIEVIRDSVDANMNSLTAIQDGCNMGDEDITFNVTNIGIKAINPLTVSYSVNGGAAITENFASLASGATTTHTFATKADLSGHGNKIIRVWHHNAADTNKLNDTLVMSLVNYPTPPNPTLEHDTVCIGSTESIIHASSFDSFMTRWYSDSAGVNEIASGNTYQINSPTSTVRRFAKSVYQVSANLGPTSIEPSINVFGVGQGLFFNVMRNKVRINSVKVTINTAGIAAISIRNPANTTDLITQSFLVPTANSEITVPLGIDLPIGTGYRMILSTSPGSARVRNGYTEFPQTIPNVLSITGSTTTSSPPRYYYFYDWNVTYDACSSPIDTVYSVYLNNVNAPAKTLVKDTAYCEYPSTYLDANNDGATYKWHDNSTNRTIPVTNSGLYIVTITHSSGCKSVDTSDVEVKTSPIFSLGNDTTICSGESVILKSGFSNAGYNHEWSNSKLDPSIEVRNPGTYFVNIFNTNTNCGYSDTIAVNFVQSPNAFLGKDTFACNFEPITINAPNTGTYVYTWDDGSTNPSRTVNLGGVNKVWVNITDISNAYGCKSSDTVIVTISELTKPDIGADITTCTKPTTIGIASVKDRLYKWSNGGTKSYTTVSDDDDYILTVTEANTTCAYTDTITVNFNENPPLDLGDELYTCNDTPVTIIANSGWTSYLWSNSFNVDRITVVPGSGSNTYTVTATGPCGTVSDSKVINFESEVNDIALPDDQLVCDSTYEISIPSQPASHTIQWSTDETTESITVNKSGTYWVTVANSCGAKSDAIRVNFDTFPVPNFNPNWSGTFASFANTSSNAVSYRWEFGDDSTSTDKHPTHQYAKLGTYEVKLTVKNSCGDSLTITKSINLEQSSSGILNTVLTDIAVYPNPAKDILNIYVPESIHKEVSIDIVGIDGRVIMSNSNKSINGVTTMNIVGLAEGSYLLRVIDSQGVQSLERISIIR